MAVVEQAIEDRRGHDGVAEYRAPFPHAAIAGHQQATPFVAPGHPLEEQMGGVGFERQVIPFTARFCYNILLTLL